MRCKSVMYSFRVVYHLKQKAAFFFHILKTIQIQNQHLMVLFVPFIFSIQTYLHRPTDHFPGLWVEWYL